MSSVSPPSTTTSTVPTGIVSTGSSTPAAPSTGGGLFSANISGLPPTQSSTPLWSKLGLAGPMPPDSTNELDFMIQQFRTSLKNSRLYQLLAAGFARGLAFDQILSMAKETLDADLTQAVNSQPDKQTQIDSLKAQLDTLYAQLVSARDAKQVQVNNLQTQVNQIYAQLVSARDAKQVQVNNLQNQLNQLKPTDPTYDSVRQQLLTAQSDLAALQAKVATPTTDPTYNSAYQQLVSAQNDLATLNTKVATPTTDANYNNIYQQWVSAQSDLTNLKTQEANLRTEIANLSELQSSGLTSVSQLSHYLASKTNSDQSLDKGIEKDQKSMRLSAQESFERFLDAQKQGDLGRQRVSDQLAQSLSVTKNRQNDDLAKNAALAVIILSLLPPTPPPSSVVLPQNG